MKIAVYCTYATDFDTWNVVKCGSRDCLFYGTIEQLEQWLIDNSDIYFEE